MTRNALFILLVIFSFQKARAENFKDIYDETISLLEMSWIYGEQSEEVPLINLRTRSIEQEIERSKKIELLRRRLKYAEANEEDKVVMKELDNYLNQQSLYINICKSNEWTYISEWTLTEYLRIISNPSSGSIRTEVSNYDFVYKAFDNLALMLEENSIRAKKSYDNYAVPSISSINQTIYYLEQNYQGYLELSIRDIVDRYPCENCEDVPIEKFLSYFEKIVSPHLDSYLNDLKKMKDRAANTVYLVPKSFKEDCMTSVMYNVGGMLLSPEDILEMGEKELKETEDKMLSIMRDYLHKEELTLKEMNEYLVSIRGEQLDYADAKEYLDKIDEVIERTIQFSGLVTSKIVTKPSIKDYNYETDSFSESWYDCTINVNSKAPSMKHALAGLMIHEGIPGHHLDLCNDGLVNDFPLMKSKLNDHMFNTDRREGWAFYMEEVADDLGFYDGALERIGYLEWVRVRSLRLILTYRYYFDEWSQEQAREFHIQHAVIPEKSMNAEVSRAMGWGDQVLNYMIGRESIKSMRDIAKNELGDKFDLIKFHDYILEHQNVSLTTIKAELNGWIEKQR